MFCYQCEQTDRSNEQPGCSTAKGNCGKDATTADLQDLLVHAVQGMDVLIAHAVGLAEAADGDERRHLNC